MLKEVTTNGVRRGKRITAKGEKMLLKGIYKVMSYHSTVSLFLVKIAMDKDYIQTFMVFSRSDIPKYTRIERFSHLLLVCVSSVSKAL